MPLLIAILAFASLSLAVWAFGQPADDPVARRIRGVGFGPTAAERTTEGSFFRRILFPGARRLGEWLAQLLPGNLVRSVDRLLIYGNSSLSTSVFLSIWLASAVLGLLVLWYVLATTRNPNPLQYAMISLAVLAPFGLGPYIVVRRKAKTRQKKISRALPDALDLLVTGVEAGLGVDASFVMVTEKTGGPLAQTIALYLKYVGLGRARRDAFAEVADRTGVQDLIRVAAAVAQAEQVGATLGDVLRLQAEDLRLLRRQRAQEAAQRAPVLMTIPMALCFLPAMGAVVIVPSILNLMDFLSKLKHAP